MSDSNLKLTVTLSAVERITAPLKAVQAVTKGTTAHIKALREKLGELNKATQQIEGYRKVAEQTAKTGHAWKDAQARAKALAEQMKATAEPGRELRKAFADATAEARKLSSQHAELTQKQERLRSALREAGIETGQLVGHQRELKTQTREVTRELEAQQRSLNALNEKMRAQKAVREQYDRRMGTRDTLAGAGASMLGVGAVTAAGLAAPLHAYAELNAATTALSVAQLKADGTLPKELADVKKQAIELGNILPGTTADYLRSATALLENGTQLSAVVHGGLKSASYLGVILKLPSDEAAEMVANFRESFGLAETELEKMADITQRAKFGFGLNTEEIRYGAQYAGATLRGLGLTGIENTKKFLAIQGALRQRGIQGSTFGTGFAAMLMHVSQLNERLGKHSRIMREVNADLAHYHVKLEFFDKAGKFKGMDNMLDQLKKLKAITNDQKRANVTQQLFGDEGGRIAGNLLDMGSGGLQASLAKMEAQADLMQRIKLLTQSTSATWEAFTGTVTNCLAVIGGPIANTFMPYLQSMNDFIGNTLQPFIERHQTLVAVLGVLAVVFAVVVSIMGAITLTLAALLGPLAMAQYGFELLGIEASATVLYIRSMLGGLLNTVIAVVFEIGGAMAAAIGANPVLAAIALIVVVVVAVVAYIWSHWDSLGPKFRALWDGIKHACAIAWDWIGDKAHTVGQAVVGYFMNWTLAGVIYRHWDAIMAFFKALPTRFAAFGSMVMDGLVHGITEGLGRVKAAITGAGEQTVNWFKQRLGIHSPSRVFAELGGFTMQGLALGLERGRQGPLGVLQGIARQLSQPIVGGAVALASSAMAPAAQVHIDHRSPLGRDSASPAQAAHVSHYNITVHAAPGMDERQLARAVADELTRQQQAKAAASRSRIGDRD